MGLSYKKGLVFIGSAILLYFLNKVFALIESHLTDITRYFVLSNLTIIDIISITIGVIGIIISLINYLHIQKRKKGYSVLINPDKTDSDLIVEIKDKYWYPPEKQEYNKSVVYTIAIKTLFRNLNQPTTIHAIHISFQYKGKSYNLSPVENIQIKMTTGDSINNHFNFFINEQKIQIDKNPTNVTLKIVHTYNKVEQIIDEIPKLPIKFI